MDRRDVNFEDVTGVYWVVKAPVERDQKEVKVFPKDPTPLRLPH